MRWNARVGMNHSCSVSPPTPTGSSRVWNGPAPYPSSEIVKLCTRTRDIVCSQRSLCGWTRRLGRLSQNVIDESEAVGADGDRAHTRDIGEWTWLATESTANRIRWWATRRKHSRGFLKAVAAEVNAGAGHQVDDLLLGATASPAAYDGVEAGDKARSGAAR